MYKAIGAFIFLRFYNTGITVPESFGLMQTPPKQSARRQLILLSKVLQNLANGVKFGAKETFMTKLNGFIISNQEKLKAFYDKISVSLDENCILVHINSMNRSREHHLARLST